MNRWTVRRSFHALGFVRQPVDPNLQCDQGQCCAASSCPAFCLDGPQHVVLIGMQGHVLQQDLSRWNAEGCIEPLLLEEGKAALLNVCGPVLLQRQQLSSLSLKEYIELLRVRK